MNCLLGEINVEALLWKGVINGSQVSSFVAKKKKQKNDDNAKLLHHFLTFDVDHSVKRQRG